jgi:uroporphyrinogen-III synthase
MLSATWVVGNSTARERKRAGLAKVLIGKEHISDEARAVSL